MIKVGSAVRMDATKMRNEVGEGLKTGLILSSRLPGFEDTERVYGKRLLELWEQTQQIAEVIEFPFGQSESALIIFPDGRTEPIHPKFLVEIKTPIPHCFLEAFIEQF